MSEPSTPSFQGMCHYIGQLSKASKAGMRAALADCPKCHFNLLEGLLHSRRPPQNAGAHHPQRVRAVPPV